MKTAQTKRAHGATAPIRLVLSTGRTGSTLLREYLKSLDCGLDIAFEPYPSRRSYMLWNAAQKGLFPKGLVHKDYLRVMSRAWKQRPTSSVRIEMHAYLAPMVCELAQYYEPLEFLHLVRHPFTWITSLANFKAAGWRRAVIDFVPFARHQHPDVRNQWPGLSELERAAWRWRFTNEKLLSLKQIARRYELVRYEDLVSSDTSTAALALARARSLLLHGTDAPEQKLDLGERHNASHKKQLPAWQSWTDEQRGQVVRICEPLLAKLGYETSTT